MALADFQSLIDNLVRDSGGDITAPERDEAIGRAVIRYSTDRPRPKVEDVVAAGGNFLDLPPGWEADFSRLARVETPPDEAPPALLDQDAFSIYTTPTADKIMLLVPLAAAAAVRLGYTISHLVDSGNDTVPNKDREAVASWGAALLLEQLANKHSGDREPTIQADSVDHQAKGRDFARRAKDLRKLYFDHLGIDPKRTVAAGAIVDLDLDDSLGRDRLVHTGRRR